MRFANSRFQVHSEWIGEGKIPWSSGQDVAPHAGFVIWISSFLRISSTLRSAASWTESSCPSVAPESWHTLGSTATEDGSFVIRIWEWRPPARRETD